MEFKNFNKYWCIAKRLHTNQLQKKSSNKLNFSETDLFKTDIGQRGGDYFLGFYSEDGILAALKKYGIYNLLKKKGFNNVFTTIDTSDIYKHKLAIYFEKKDVDHLLFEVVLRKEYVKISMPFDNELQNKKFEVLVIDWMSMQNPLKDFTEDRPQLPGQKYPGLGFSHVAIKLLMIMNWRLNLAGLLNIPEHYHNACFYSKVFYYVNPNTQAIFNALQSQFKNYNLSKLTWAMDWGCILDVHENKPFKWIIDKQLVPMDTKLKKLFFGSVYKNYVSEQRSKYQFKFDQEKYDYCFQKISKKEMENII